MRRNSNCFRKGLDWILEGLSDNWKLLDPAIHFHKSGGNFSGGI